MGALSSTQSSNSNQTTKMKSLLVCFSVVAVALAAEEAPAAVLPALGYPYAFGGAYPYAYGHGAAYTIPSPVQYKYVPKEVAAVTPAATVPLAYAGYPYAAGLPYAHAGLPYAHAGLPYAHAGYAGYPHVTYAKPVVQEIEVPTPVYKQVIEKVPLAPLCQNHLGYAVPCL